MSSVLKRFQKISEMEFYRKSADFRDKITQCLLKENYCPKRKRQIFAFPIIALADKLMEEVVTANNIYPYNEERLAERKHHQELAIRYCELLWDKLNWYIRDRWKGNIDADNPLPGDLVECLELLDLAETRIAEWRKKAKLVNYKTPSN